MSTFENLISVFNLTLYIAFKTMILKYIHVHVLFILYFNFQNVQFPIKIVQSLWVTATHRVKRGSLTNVWIPAIGLPNAGRVTTLFNYATNLIMTPSLGNVNKEKDIVRTKNGMVYHKLLIRVVKSFPVFAGSALVNKVSLFSSELRAYSTSD